MTDAAAEPGPGGPVVVLVGAAGAGKTVVGTVLAERLDTAFVEADDLLAQAAGRSCEEVMVGLGEAAYRDLERDAVAAALGADGAVVALGASAPADADTRRRLAGLPVAWLRVNAANAANRSGLNAPRPVGLGNVRAALGALIAANEPFYTEVATVVVDTDFRDVGAVADDVLAGLGRRRIPHAD